MRNSFLQTGGKFFHLHSTLKFFALPFILFSLKSQVLQAQYNDMDWGTYFDDDYNSATGFTNEELVDGVAVDKHSSPESIYIVGRTKSIGSYTDTMCGANTFQYGSSDAFLAKYGVDSNGACGALLWVSYFGNPHGSDYGYCIALDYDEEANETYIYIGGDTKVGTNEDSIYNGFACSFDGCPNDVFQKYRRDEWEGWIAKYQEDGTLLRWTMLGGNRNGSAAIDQVLSLTIDPVSHDVLATGYTESLNIGQGAVNYYDNKYNNKGDGYIAVLDPCLSTLKFFSYYDINNTDTLIPNQQDRCHTIAIDDHRNIYLSGTTESSGGIATPGVFQTSYKGGTDAFASKWKYGVANNGVTTYTPAWGSYIAGKATDRGRGLAIDDAGNCFVTGWTTSKNFPVSNLAYQKVHGGANDAFISKFDSTGKLVWSTLYGGAGDEQDNGIIWYKNPNDASDKTVYIIGLTNSLLLPLKNPIVANLNGNINNANPKYDAFVAGVSDESSLSTQQVLKFGTYLGGSRDETNQQALSYGPNMDFGSNYEMYLTFSTKSENIGLISHADKIVVGYHPTSPILNVDAFLGKLINTANPAMFNCSEYVARDQSEQNEISIGSIKYYPNPVTDQLHVELEADQSGVAKIDIVDVLGRNLRTQTFTVNSGANEINLDFSGMTPGLYLLHVNMGEENYSVNVIRQ
jgi:hypothetical protein